MVKRPGALCHRAFVADLGLALEGAIEVWTSKALTLPTCAQQPPGMPGTCTIMTSLRITLPHKCRWAVPWGNLMNGSK
jgi:hypothetical protein